VTVYGVKREPGGAAKAVILLFHQAGSGAAEYDPIAPRLVELGYATLAIDQRSGDGMYGPNLTVQHLGGSRPLLSARPDLEAALEWAKKNYASLPIIVWGSSYSASLVFVLAAEHPARIAKLLAFSPGEYFGNELRVVDYAKRVTAPVFIDEAADMQEITDAATILDAAASVVKEQYRPVHGIHGSSTLRKDRNAAGYEENWKQVEAFLRR
jgi:pimeloyl-ACP methyl ester carboxylesterase